MNVRTDSAETGASAVSTAPGSKSVLQKYSPTPTNNSMTKPVEAQRASAILRMARLSSALWASRLKYASSSSACRSWLSRASRISVSRSSFTSEMSSKTATTPADRPRVPSSLPR